MWQAVPIEAIRIDAPRAEARWWLAHAASCTVVVTLASLMILRFPLPLFDQAFTHDLWYAVGFKLCWMLLLPLGWMAWRGYRAEDLLMGWSLSLRSALAVAVAVAAGLLINAGHLPHIQALMAVASPASLAVGLGVGVLLPLLSAALPEELVFRALLQTRLEATSGRLLAIAVTALLFVAWHLPSRYLLSQGVEGTAGDLGSVLLGTGLPVLLVALVFGWIWDRWRSLPVLVALHWAIDLLPGLRHALGGSF